MSNNNSDKRIYTLSEEAPAKAVVKMGVPLIARCLGANDSEKARHTLTAGFVLTVLNILIVAAVSLVLLYRFISAKESEENG